MAGRCVGRFDAEADCTASAAFAHLATALPAGALLLTSGLRRSEQTAEALIAAGYRPAARALALEWLEQDFGVWDGRRYDDLAARDPAYWPFWRDPARNAPPGGESFADLARRVTLALPALRRRFAAHAQVVAVIHAGPIRALLAAQQGLSLDQALGLKVRHLHPYPLAAVDAPPPSSPAEP